MIIQVKRAEQFRMESTYVPNGTKTLTDVSTPHGGIGEYPTPVELMAEALAACGLTTACMYATRNGINTEGFSAEVEDIKFTNEHDSVNEITIRYHFGKDIEASLRKRLESFTLHGCTVGNTLKADKNFFFEYDV